MIDAMTGPDGLINTGGTMGGMGGTPGGGGGAMGGMGGAAGGTVDNTFKCENGAACGGGMRCTSSCAGGSRTCDCLGGEFYCNACSKQPVPNCVAEPQGKACERSCKPSVRARRSAGL